MSYQSFRPNGFSYLPQVVKNIIILNVLVFLIQLFGPNFLGFNTNSLALYYPGLDEFRPYQFITYMFVHGGLMHIFFNLFAFWMFGSAIEQVMGSKKFLVYYLITGIGAALLHNLVTFIDVQPTLNAVDEFLKNPTPEVFNALVNSPQFKLDFLSETGKYQVIESINEYQSLYKVDPAVAKVHGLNLMNSYRDARLSYMSIPPVVGASGSVFGILLAFGMLFPNTLIYLYFAIPLKAKFFVIIYGALELFLGIVNSPSDNIAHFAHLGGMIFGFILIKLWGIKRRN